MSLFSLAPLFQGFVGKDYQELVFVVIAMAISFGMLVAFGAWWSR